jgi:hypothetical protein
MSHLYHLPNGLAMCRRPVGAVSAIASSGAGAKPTDVDNRLLVCRDAAVNDLKCLAPGRLIYSRPASTG